MKTKLMIAFALICSLSLFAQEHKTKADTSMNSAHIKTIFGANSCHGKIPLGWFIETDAGFTRLGHHNALLPGINAGLIINHNWTVGMSGNFFSNPHGMHFHYTHTDSNGIITNRSADLRGGYGGALFQYTLLPRSRIHVSFPLVIGCGYLYWSNIHKYTEDNGTITESGYYNNHKGTHFFVIEPGVKLELNLTTNFRMGLGVSYRYVPDLDLKYASDDLMNQFTAKLFFSFGKF